MQIIRKQAKRLFIHVEPNISASRVIVPVTMKDNIPLNLNNKKSNYFYSNTRKNQDIIKYYLEYLKLISNSNFKMNK